MQNKIPVLIIICCLLLTGCRGSKVIEDLAILEAVSFDQSDSNDNPIKTTVLFPTVSKEGMAGTQFLSASGKSSHETFINLQNLTNLKLVGGQSTILFGKDLSKKGIFKIVESLSRDPEFGTRVKLAIVEGKGEELLKKKIPSIPDNAEYLYTFMEKLGTQNRILNTDKYRFLRDYYDDGIDPVLPVFTYEKDNIELKGLGTFKDDQYISLLTLSETHILNLLCGNIHNGSLMVNMVDEKTKKTNQLFLSDINSNNDKKVNKRKNKTVEIMLDLKGSVLEYTGSLDISNEKYQRQLEKQIEDYIKTNSKKLLVKLQKDQTDPIGIGTLIRNRTSYEKWKKLNWNQTYSNLNFKVNVKVDLINTGKAK